MQKISLKQNEELIIPIIWTGGEKEIIYDISLNEPNAKITFLALILARNNQSIKLNITVCHNAENTKSEVIVKSVLMDTASVNFNGLVKIKKGAKKTNAWLAAHILLLSKKARGQAIPSLEILENDIKAGHATTVGRVNDLELFYLMSRGLTEQMAKKIIVEGFLGSIIERFPEKDRVLAEKKLNDYYSSSEARSLINL